MFTRKALRLETANYLNSLPKDELFARWQITRIGDVTGLDRIGVPVMTSCRPASKIVSVNAGKSLYRPIARAGAIAEAIEFSTFECPGEHRIGLAAPLDYPLAAGSTWTPETEIAVEPMTHFMTGKVVDFPSSLIWLTRPDKEPPYFQKSSNGQATGGSMADALLQGIYECVERDQYILWRCSLTKLGIWPPRVRFDHTAVDAIERAGFRVFLFCCTADIQIPVYWALIIDPAWRHCGGWGAHLCPWIAAERAVLEAIQSRAVVISGARDDLDRRDPDWTQAKAALFELQGRPFVHEVKEPELGLPVQEELALVLNRLGDWSKAIWYKHINFEPIHVVKVQILGFEQPVLGHWKEIRWSKLREQYLSGRVFTEPITRFFRENNS